jgi:hypothetical protein
MVPVVDTWAALLAAQPSTSTSAAMMVRFTIYSFGPTGSRFRPCHTEHPYQPSGQPTNKELLDF